MTRIKIGIAAILIMISFFVGYCFGVSDAKDIHRLLRPECNWLKVR